MCEDTVRIDDIRFPACDGSVIITSKLRNGYGKAVPPRYVLRCKALAIFWVELTEF